MYILLQTSDEVTAMKEDFLHVVFDWRKERPRCIISGIEKNEDILQQHRRFRHYKMAGDFKIIEGWLRLGIKLIRSKEKISPGSGDWGINNCYWYFFVPGTHFHAVLCGAESLFFI